MKKNLEIRVCISIAKSSKHMQKYVKQNSVFEVSEIRDDFSYHHIQYK